MNVMVKVGRAAREDWAALRAIRLRALGRDPDAFGSSLGDELARPEGFWRDRIASSAWFLAWVGRQSVGVVAAVAPPFPTSVELQLDAMWVDPAWRGHGVGEALVDAVLALARDQGAECVSLTVVDGNDHARRLYERAGFRATGEREPRPRNPCQMRERLRLSLVPA
ncbi:GNAT family N-acetyltransferase [Streptomyces montanisoli]|uniref:GNAT family N-acetyltransferase n=1 Tax=Streptomyces montanisoli TaxID=2798581 RepID=A0A940MAT8_9ACTN|nr:GNAT family N-acetyltransferase [Streptomyces montanisoli]MBP0459494.1 GNAT family N-acetyltransferase [Streptomyces montanisoli]